MTDGEWQFLSKEIEVERDRQSLMPISFCHNSRRYDIEEILDDWQDWGFSGGAPRKKDWRMRRHRNCYLVRTVSGEVFEIYHDRGIKPGEGVWIAYRRKIMK